MSKIVAVGASIGGTEALCKLFGCLPGKLPAPVVVVLHRGRDDSRLLVEILQRRTKLLVKEAEDKEELLPATVYLAPADYHLLVEAGHCALSLEAPIAYARPSIDALFESTAESYGPRALAVVLTGSNADGAQGAALVKERGGRVVVQEPGECASATMPLAAMARTDVDKVLTLIDIAGYIEDYCSENLSEDQAGDAA